MAQQDSEPAKFNPKHRIIGAIILVALAVIFIPMLLDETQAPSDLKDTPEIPLPPSSATPDTKVIVTPVAQLEAKDKQHTSPAGETPEPKSDGAPVTAFQGEPLKPVESRSAPASPTSSPEPAKPAPTKVEKPEKVEKPAKPDAPGWVVQVGVYANRENADRVESKLKSQGHSVRKENIKISTGTAVRLRVGPYRDKAVAQKARDQLEKDIGEKAVVLSYP